MKPADPDDLFGDPAPAKPAAAPTPANPPAKPADPDDLFGDPAPAKPAAAPAPAKPPAKPADPDDLFGDPAPAKPEPAKPEPKKSEIDDLFGGAQPKEEMKEEKMPDQPVAAPVKNDSADDLFGAPAEPAKPAAKPAPKADDVDDLFGGPAEPAKEQPKAPAKAEDDPFSSAAREPVENPIRTWVDNTGLYKVNAKFYELLTGKVRLLKDNGKFCTFEIRRLSENDRQYVVQLAAKLGLGEVGTLASNR